MKQCGISKKRVIEMRDHICIFGSKERQERRLGSGGNVGRRSDSGSIIE